MCSGCGGADSDGDSSMSCRNGGGGGGNGGDSSRSYRQGCIRIKSLLK